MTRQEIKEMCIKEFGTIEEIKKKSTPTIDGKHKELLSGKGVSVRFVSNPKFEGGIINGGGVGVYARIKGIGFYKDVKID